MLESFSAMNRHHYSIFVHNCHLILLLRRESTGEADMSRFQPTEWRWKLEEVCDGNWHQYAISFDLPEVRQSLYISFYLWCWVFGSVIEQSISSCSFGFSFDFCIDLNEYSSLCKLSYVIHSFIHYEGFYSAPNSSMAKKESFR